MLCTKCGKDNNPFAKYCDDCGELLPEVEMILSDDEFVEEERELKVSEAAPVIDAVRSPQHIGNMPVEDLGDQETFEPQMLSFNTQAYNAAQANLGYVRSNDVPILTSPNQIDKDGFVPSSAFSNLKEPKQKKSKVRIFFIILSILVILSIATFFAAKYTIEIVSTKFMREHTAQFVVNAYQLSAKQIIENEELISVFSPESKIFTTRTTVTKKNQSVTTATSLDRTSHRLYWNTSTTGTKNDINIELFANTAQCNLQYTKGDDKFDYFLPLENLGSKALTSTFGTQGENYFGITQEQYDSFINLYEYIYDYILLDEEEKEKQSSLKKLFEKICTDIDEISEIEIKDEQVSVEGSEKTSVYLITRTITGTQIFTILTNDLKEWADDTGFITGDIKEKFLSYIGELDKQFAGISSFGVKIENYINKSDNSLMQTVITAIVNNEKSESRIYFGTDPAGSDKIIFTTNAIKAKETDDPNQSSSAEANQSANSMIEISREKTTLTSTYTLLISTPNNEAKYVLARSNADGTYTLESTVKESATSEPVVTTTKGVIKFDSVTFSWTTESDDMTTEYYYTTLPEMNEISSQNNILFTTSQQIRTDWKKLSDSQSHFLTLGEGIFNPVFNALLTFIPD